MTIQEILKRSIMLLGLEAGTPLELPARERLMAALDSALNELARCFPLQARCKVNIQNGEAALPAKVLTPRALYKDGKREAFSLLDGKIAAEDGYYTLVYYRTPPRVFETDPLEVLPYPEDVLAALPFYCAALFTMGEDTVLYGQLMEQYNTKLSAALGYRPTAAVESGGSL